MVIIMYLNHDPIAHVLEVSHKTGQLIFYYSLDMNNTINYNTIQEYALKLIFNRSWANWTVATTFVVEGKTNIWFARQEKKIKISNQKSRKTSKRSKKEGSFCWIENVSLQHGNFTSMVLMRLWFSYHSEVSIFSMNIWTG